MSASCSIDPDFAKVSEHRLLVGALLGAAVQLADRDHRNLEFLGQKLDLPGEFGDFLLT